MVEFPGYVNQTRRSVQDRPLRSLSIGDMRDGRRRRTSNTIVHAAEKWQATKWEIERRVHRHSLTDRLLLRICCRTAKQQETVRVMCMFIDRFESRWITRFRTDRTGTQTPESPSLKYGAAASIARRYNADTRLWSCAVSHRRQEPTVCVSTEQVCCIYSRKRIGPKTRSQQTAIDRWDTR